MAEPWIRTGDRLLDVGCHDRVLIDRVRERLRSATGVDAIVTPEHDDHVELRRGRFPGDFRPEPGSFDCITALAVLEHVSARASFAAACHDALVPGGRVVLTVPHRFVDPIVGALVALRLADGMALEEHHGFDVAETVPLFERAGFRLTRAARFQLGLNHLFVFEKPAPERERP